MFRRKSSAKGLDEPISVGGRLPTSHGKKMSTDIHDPILTAIHSEQPFQVSNDPTTVQMSPPHNSRDIFGNPIQEADHSNPTRSRNERPLDTIRSFEWSCTGDDRIRDEMESARLGWSTRNDFNSMPRFDSNPYAMASAPPAAGNVISFGGPDSTTDAATYTRPVPAEIKKKKKRGLFGRKN